MSKPKKCVSPLAMGITKIMFGRTGILDTVLIYQLATFTFRYILNVPGVIKKYWIAVN